MRLKRLELFGFKSFADRTVLDFGDDTLTGIVGPNGCGKSNVVDSIRWVLGETRPTSLRGGGMTDVIFKGSASRPALSVAEATLVLDNGDGRFEGRGPEVAITRRLFKSGEGEYVIDGQRVRLKDVRDLLFDTGLGSRGYAILEQGRIDAVLSANPVQRRSVFEEAAGISRYRQRRHETELRLKRVEQDLVRLDDVMGELRTRVRSLKIQAGKAERFVQARDEWRREKQRLFQHRHHDLVLRLGEVGPRLEALEARLAQQRAERGRVEAEIDQRERERGALSAELERIAGESARLAGECRALDERRSQLGLRAAAWRADARAERERASALAAQRAEREAEREALGQRLAELERAAADARGRAEELGARLRERNRDYKQVRADVQDQNERVLAGLHEKTAAQNRARSLEEARGPAEERRGRGAARLEAFDGSVRQLEVEAAGADERERAAAGALAQAESARDAAALRARELDRRREERRRARAELELERARLSSRIESLVDRERELEDLGAGTRRVLEAVAAGELPLAADGLRGLVADHLRADTRLARALDACLTERVHALVARDEGAARAVLAWLEERREGQVGIVLPGALAELERPAPSDFADHDGRVEGRLCDLVECESDLAPLARALLGDVFVVRDLALARELVARHPQWRFVTPAGELVDAAGWTGGHREVTQGPAGRRASARELESELAGVAAALEEQGRALSETEQARDRLTEELDALERSARERAAEHADAQAEARAARARLADLASSRAELARELARAADELAALERELAEATGLRARAEASFGAENERLAAMEAGRRELEREREELARDEGRARIELAQAESELAGGRHRAADLERALGEAAAELVRSEERAREAETSAEGAERESAGVGDEAARLVAQRGELEGRLEELRTAERGGRARVEALRVDAERLLGELEGVGEALSQERLARQRLELASEELARRAAEELELDTRSLEDAFEADPELAAEGALDALERRVGELKVQLDRIGPVNTDAVTELEEVGGRLEFLEAQAGDLTRSRAKLGEAIRAIDEESKRLFLETFEEVRTNFQRIFRQLFGGGKADVRLEEGVDVLEAGIDIVARPPGREMLPIGLLSGGQRTMTALALLFAVFQARPSPFCVLDEVDAALDDANIDRFIAMVDGFRSDTQFIVVTHNKGTMAACDALYGVTMEVKGVSRFVSVELDEVDEVAPDAVGGNGDGRETPRSGGAGSERDDDESGEGPRPARGLDPESGEPVVELQPAVAPEADGVASSGVGS